MWRVLVGVLLGVALSAPSVWALRVGSPTEFAEWNTNTFTQLNNILLSITNVLNGRYQLDVVTVDPEGVRSCSVGEQVLFDTGTDQLCVCVTASTKVWKCVNVT